MVLTFIWKSKCYRGAKKIVRNKNNKVITFWIFNINMLSNQYDVIQKDKKFDELE